MKKIITISLIFLATNTFAQQKIDTTKKYILTLTEQEYQAIQSKLSEAAEYEAQLQKEKTLQAYQDFLKTHTRELPNKEAKK